MAYSPVSEMPEWRTDPRRGGGYTVENQVHELDFVAWFGGEPTSVRGVVARTALVWGLAPLSVRDAAAANLAGALDFSHRNLKAPAISAPRVLVGAGCP